MKPFCYNAVEHEPGTVCEYCKLPVDQYGNTEEDHPNCCFPDCGCDGARLCDASRGASFAALAFNIEKGSLSLHK